MSNECRFYPVQCTDATFQKMTPQEGHVYFTTDSKKIYLGKNNQMIPMYDKANFYYATKLIVYEDTGMLPDPNVSFEYDEVNGSEFIQVNDLILNIGTDEAQDGCFYRVVRLEEDLIETLRITMRGSGGGFVDGDDPGAAQKPSFSIPNKYPGSTLYISSTSNSAEIGFKTNSSDLVNNYVTKVEGSFSNDVSNEEAKFFTIENLMHPIGVDYYVNLVPYLDRIVGQLDNTQQSITIYLHIYDAYETVKKPSYDIKVIELKAVTTEPAMLSDSNNVYLYDLIPSGSNALSSYSAKFDYYNNKNQVVYTQTVPINKSEFNTTVTCELKHVDLPHGTYTMKAYLVGVVNALTTITSNVLSHTMIHQEEGGDPLLGVVLPQKFEQYTDFKIEYLLAYGASIKSYALELKLNDEIITTESVVSGVLNEYYLSIDSTGQFNLTFKIDALNINQTYVLNVEEYSGVLPVINTNDVTLMTYLSPKGKTNNSVDKESWANIKDNTQKGTLSNFYYRDINGWLKDDNGVDYLKVSQGASVVYNAQSPLDGDPNTDGVTIELDFKLSGVYDYNEPFIECVTRYNDGNIKTGFIVDGSSFNYYLDGKVALSLHLVTEKRIRITQVISPSQHLGLTYLNGIISTIFTYEDSENQFGNNPQRPAYLTVNSNGGQIHLYGIRFYSTDLSTQKILRNYQAGLDTLEIREANYRENNIFNDFGSIDVDLLNKNGYEWDIPYVKIVGGYSIVKDDDTGDMIMAPAAGNETRLPTGKKDYRAIDIEMHYPKYDPETGKNHYFKDYHDFSFVSEFGDSGLNVTNAFDKVMTKGAWMYAQGTSSMVYPVKNLRVKTTGGNYKFIVQPDLDPVKLICFKADYMESSGSHNTGAANYIDNIVYKFSGLKTPGQKHFDNKTIVTCIKGHPCVIFWSPTGEEGTFQFVGKYNFNLDKATPEPFGFMEDKNDPTFGHLTDENGELVLDEKGNVQNSIYCFEFLDNIEKVCNFTCDIYSTYEGYDVYTHEPGMTYETNDKTESERYYDTWYSKRKNEDGEIVTGWQLGFESRHPEDKTDDHDADVLYELASWINNTYALEQTDGRAAAVKKFKDEYWKYLDEKFTVAYYVITDALLMMDSRVKNMMIATWGKEWRYLLTDGTVTSQRPEDESKIQDSHFGFIWYPIFYDMDTMLGLNNIGDRAFEYYDDDSRKIYNGDTILWYFVKDALPEQIAAYYRLLEEKTAMTKEIMLPCFSENQGTLANEAFYNEDAKYKYISPYLLKHAGVKLPAAQGSRELDREYFITNRLNYLNGKYSTESHQEKDCLEYRMTYPKKVENPTEEEDIKLNKSLEAVPPSGKFDLTSARTCYAGVKVGATFANRKFNGEETLPIELDVTSADGSETYITGISNIAGVGSLADKYPYGFNFNGLAGSPLRQLILGSHNKDYYNPNLANDTTAFDLSMLTYLEEFNMENCSTYTRGLNFAAKNPVYDAFGNLISAATTGCSNIKIINLLGSNTSSINLPTGGILEELRLPDSIRSLKLDSFVELKDDKFTLGSFNYDTDDYENNFVKLSNIYIKNTNIDSYNIFKQNLNSSQSNLETYYVEGFNWVLDEADDFEINDGSIVGIKILDNLQKLRPSSGSHASSLIGTLTIDIAGYSVNEADLSAKYLNENVYPNLTIKYGDKTDGAIRSFYINFYDQKDTETVGNMSPELFEAYTPVLSLETDQYRNLTISQLIENSAKELPTPVKDSTDEDNYFFTGRWCDWRTKTMYYQNYEYVQVPNDADFPGWDETYYAFDTVTRTYYEYTQTIYPEGDVYLYKRTIPENSFLKVVPANTDGMILIPEFEAVQRTYKIAFYINGNEYVHIMLPFNASLGTETGGNISLKYIYLPDYNNELEENERFTFKKWISEEDYRNGVANPDPVVFDDITITGPMNFYAYIEIEDATKVASDYNLFTIDNKNATVNGVVVSGQYRICINNSVGFEQIIGGKITLPSKDENGNIIKIIDNFQGIKANSNVEIYFLEDAQYESIADKAFNGAEVQDEKLSIKKIYLPNTIKTIGTYAFAGTSIEDMALPNGTTTIGSYAFANSSIENIALPDSITTIDDRAFNGAKQLKLTTLPANLTSLGIGSFASCSNITIADLPSGITKIPLQCFALCPNLKITQLGGPNFTALEIDSQAFLSSATGQDITTLTILSPTTFIHNSATPPFGSAYTKLQSLSVYDTFGYADEANLFEDLFGRSMPENFTISSPFDE